MKKVCQIWEAGHVENGTEALIIYSVTSVSHFSKGLECPENHSFDKVSKKDDKVDLNELSTKYTKIHLNSNILSFQFRKVWCCLHWVKLRFYDLFAAESVSQQCWSKWATKLKLCWVFSNQQQNLRAKRTGNFSFGIFFE